MDTSDVRSLIVTVDDLIFSHRGEHLDDIEQAILKGVFDHEKYAEIAKNTKRSEKYIKYVSSRTKLMCRPMLCPRKFSSLVL